MGIVVFRVSPSLTRPRFFNKYWIELASVFLVSVGVACELGAGLMIESKNASLRAIDIQLRSKNAELRSKSDRLLALVTEQSGNAEKSATAAGERLREVKAEAKTFKHDLLLQGPRWKLLDAGKNEFVKELKPYPKQKVLIMYCGSLLSAPPEPFRLGMDAAEFLAGNPGAGWNATPPKGWFSCPANGPFTFGGIMLLVSSASDDSVKHAATALSAVLNKLEISTSVQTIKPTEVGPNTFVGRMFGADSPWDLAIKDPTSFVLFIGTNSMHAWNPVQKPQNR
jgi:hypothetical protein